MRRPLRVSVWGCCGWLVAHPVWAQPVTQPGPPAKPAALSAPAFTPPPAPEDDMAIIDVQINGQPQETPRPLLRRGTQWLASARDLQGWNLVIPSEPTLRSNGVDYYDLRALPGSRLAFDEVTQTIDLQLAPEAFETSVGAARGIERPPISASVFGTFLNYDVIVQQDATGTRLSGVFDATASADWGNLGTTFLAGQSTFNTQATTRLDSAYTRDDPDRLRRLTIGDSVTQASSWSTPVRFGGIQFGTRFGLQPGYITYPLPTLRGGTAVPSSVEVYVDNVLRYQQPVAAGPFAINNVPVLSGAGEMRFAVTDTLGVRRLVTTPYYVSSNLLRAGLSDYSVEAGWTRLAYGQRSFDYGDPFASGSWRHGLTDAITADVLAEANAKSRTAGAGVTWVWSPFGEFSVHGAVSSAPSLLPGTGRLVRASYTRNSSDWNFSIVREVASNNFTQIAWQDDFSHLSGQTQVFVGKSFGRYGTVGASFTQLSYNTGDRVQVTSANWSIPVGTKAALGTYIARSQQNGGHSSTTVGVTLTVNFGDTRNGSVSVQKTGTASQSVQADFTQLPVNDQGFGYRLRGAQGDGARVEAGLDYRTRWAIMSADASTVQGQTATRLRASGSVGMAGGLPFATRASADALALVTVEGSPGITIYRENQPWAVTDKSGRAIVPGLHAYGSNYLSIDAGDLPIEVTLRRDSVVVVPRFKSVADVRFDLSLDMVANVTVVLPDGEVLPPGVEVRGTGRAEPLVSGFNGALSIAGPKSGEVFEARWRNQRCRFALGDIDPSSKLPSLGPYTCNMGTLGAPSPTSAPLQ